MSRPGVLAFTFAILFAGCANAVAPNHDAGLTGGSDAGAPNPTTSGFAGHGSVAGGVVSKSASYKLVGTLTQGNSAGSSAHYSEHSGVLGATQK